MTELARHVRALPLGSADVHSHFADFAHDDTARGRAEEYVRPGTRSADLALVMAYWYMPVAGVTRSTPFAHCCIAEYALLRTQVR
jgi:hypothetical protein